MQEYTLYFSPEELARFDLVKAYDYMDDTSGPEVFEQALYPIFAYYKKRTPHVEIGTPNQSFIPGNEDLLIETTRSRFKLFFQKVFPKKNTLYLDQREALLDVERTWKILSDSRDIYSYKKVFFSMGNWTKMLYAYRIHTIYSTEVVDITKN